MSAAYLGGPSQAEPTELQRKVFSTVQARLALRSFVVHQLGDGGFLVCKWNLTRSVPDLQALQRFAEAVGA